MKTYLRFKYVLVLTMLLMAWMPSARVMASNAFVASLSNEVFYDDELEAEINNLRAYARELWDISQRIAEELNQKATEEEAPELYERLTNGMEMLEYLENMIYRISSMDEVYACQAMIREIETFFMELSEDIAAFGVSNTFIATIEGVDMMFMVISEEDKTCQVGVNKSDHQAVDTSTSGIVTIPATVNGYSVISIGDYAFKECRNIKQVVVPEGVISIGKLAFEKCENMKRIVIPEGVKSIGEQALYGCTSLTTLEIPASLTSIGYAALAVLPNLESIKVAEGNPLFDSRDNCNAIIITASMGLLKGCKNTIIPEGITFLDGCSFCRVADLVNIELPSSLESIGGWSFEGTGLTSILIPEKVSNIGYEAFCLCENLTSVNLPAALTSIDRYAFSGCPNLTAVYSYIQQPFVINPNVFEYYDSQEGETRFTNATLYVPAGTKAFYEATEGWKNFQNIVEMEGEEIVIPDEAIDLGLPSGTKWAPWNVGASKPEDYGGYYAWGETEVKDIYSWETYIHCDGTAETCHDIGTNIAGTEYDVAHVKWGGSWRMPTEEEMNELIENCDYEWTELNGVMGGKFTSRKNGATIFLPAAGGRLSTEIEDINGYWSGTIADDDYHWSSFSIFFDPDGRHCNASYGRVYGFTVRPVLSSDQGEPEPYAVLSDDGQTVTFYYDDQKAIRGGVDINNSENYDHGFTPYGNATTAVFDASFANYRPVSTAYWFWSCGSLTTITGLENLKTDNVTDMKYMFSWCSSLTSLDLSSFNTSNVTDMSYMFEGCSGLTSLNLSGFDTSNVTNMAYMFSNCSGLTSLKLSSLNTSNVTNMSYMFGWCSNLTSLDVNGINTSKVTDMGAMFYACHSLTNLDLGGFDTSNVTNMRNMFVGCSGLTNLDLSGFNTSNVTDMGQMFSGCSGLTSLDVSGFNTSNMKNMFSMFLDCSSLKSLDVSSFNTSNVTDMLQMFANCSNLTSLDLSSFNTSNVTDMSRMFLGCSGLTTIYVDEAKWSTASVIQSPAMFYKCTSLVGGNGTEFDANHTNAEYARIDKPGQPGYFTEKNAEQMDIEPIDQGETVDFSEEIDDNTDLDGNVVGDIYYNISAGDGSYNAAEGCIVVTTPTDDSVIDGQDIFGEDFQDGFTGIVFKVPAGKGTVKVEAQTFGAMVLKVKIGDNDPIEMELEGRLKVSFPYNVTEPTYVYIYGGTTSQSGVRRAANEPSSLKIYGIECTTTSISGDADGDGTIDVNDITCVAAHILGRNPANFNAAAADADGDGTIDVNDITVIAGMILNSGK